MAEFFTTGQLTGPHADCCKVPEVGPIKQKDLVLLAVKEGRLEKAINLAYIALDMEPYKSNRFERSDIFNITGEIYSLLEQHTMAIRCFEKAEELVPNPRFSYNSAVSLLGMGKHDEAVKKLESIDDKVKSDDVLRLLTIYCPEIGDNDKAIKYGRERIEKLSHGSVVPGERISMEYFNSIQDVVAERLMDAQSMLGFSYLAKRRDDEGMLCLKNATELAENRPNLPNSELVQSRAYYNIACVGALQERPQRMYWAMKRLLDVNPGQLVKLKNDEDCKAYWNNPAFKQLIATGEKRVG